MSTKVYDADQVSLVIAGIPIASGYADGEFIRLEQVSDDFVEKVGTDGEVTRSKTNDHRVKVTVRLMQSSDGNAKLSALNSLDKLAPNGAGIGPLLVRDRQGTSLHTASKCWVKKPPDVSYDREATEREWTLMAVMDARLDGGN